MAGSRVETFNRLQTPAFVHLHRFNCCYWTSGAVGPSIAYGGASMGSGKTWGGWGASTRSLSLSVKMGEGGVSQTGGCSGPGTDVLGPDCATPPQTGYGPPAIEKATRPSNNYSKNAGSFQPEFRCFVALQATALQGWLRLGMSVCTQSRPVSLVFGIGPLDVRTGVEAPSLRTEWSRSDKRNAPAFPWTCTTPFLGGSVRRHFSRMAIERGKRLCDRGDHASCPHVRPQRRAFCFAQRRWVSGPVRPRCKADALVQGFRQSLPGGLLLVTISEYEADWQRTFLNPQPRTSLFLHVYHRHYCAVHWGDQMPQYIAVITASIIQFTRGSN